MTKHTPPGSPEFRALIQPFIDRGRYPKEREIAEGEAEKLAEPVQKLLIEFFNLVEAENKIAQWGTRPPKGGKWAKKRGEICDKLRELLAADINLLEVDMVQQHAVDKGAIPDLREANGGGEYYRTSDHYMAHWACGTNVMQKGGKPWCPTCDKEPVTKRAEGPVYHTDWMW